MVKKMLDTVCIYSPLVVSLSLTRKVPLLLSKLKRRRSESLRVIFPRYHLKRDRDKKGRWPWCTNNNIMCSTKGIPLEFTSRDTLKTFNSLQDSNIYVWVMRMTLWHLLYGARWHTLSFLPFLQSQSEMTGKARVEKWVIIGFKKSNSVGDNYV